MKRAANKQGRKTRNAWIPEGWERKERAISQPEKVLLQKTDGSLTKNQEERLRDSIIAWTRTEELFLS